MAYAIGMFFEEEADAAVRRLWRRLASAGLPSLETLGHARHRPHVTLAVTDLPVASIDVEVLPSVQLPVLGTFAGDGGVLFLGAVVSAPLLALHAGVCRRLHEQWAHYVPGSWVPHCTLAMGLTPAQLSAAAGVLAGFRPIAARVVGVGVVDTRTGEVTLLTP